MRIAIHSAAPLFFTIVASLFVFCVYMPLSAHAATLRLNPGTGVYTEGGTFTANVVVNTQGQSINAAEGQLTFNKSELSVVGVSRASSIFNLWTTEPAFSNAAGTITFGGGSPSGYTGSAGTVMSVTFRALKAGSPRVNFSSGSILAADGLGTNVLTGMQGGSYTVSPKGSTPEPEYVALPNTPLAPQVTSASHPDSGGWYREKTATFSWPIPSGITGVRTLLDQSPSTIPTVVYEPPVAERTVEDVPEGVSYFHVQFKNAEGWGKVTHYRLGVDTEQPSAFTIRAADDNDQAAPQQKLIFEVTDAASGVAHYMVQVDGGEPVRYVDEANTGTYVTPELAPGHHTVVVEAVDYAGNGLVSSYSFDIVAFEPPVFTEYPNQINEEVIPVIKGTTRPGARVTVTFGSLSGQAVAQNYEIVADEGGNFAFIPDGRLSQGVYELSAVATDASGAQSDRSEVIRIAVQQPGYVRIGSFVVSLLSIVVPALALLSLTLLGSWYTWHRFVVMRRRLRKEVTEAEQSLAHEFDSIVASLKDSIAKLEDSRKGKLTRAESALIKNIAGSLEAAEKRVRKEIEDIERVVNK